MALTSHPDLILLDMAMPQMDGITMMHELRKNDWGKSVPVVIFANLTDNGEIAEATENNASAYLVKTDWKLKDLVKKVQEKLS